MTDAYKHFAQDRRWIQVNYSKFMENSQSLSTRLNTQLCNIVPSLEMIDMTEDFYFKEQYLIQSAKYMNFDENEGAHKLVTYLDQRDSLRHLE